MCTKKITFILFYFFKKRIVEFVTFLPSGNEREPTAKKNKKFFKKKAAAAAASRAICYPLIYARGLNLLHNSSSSFLPFPT
jgi:hypothetical protein